MISVGWRDLLHDVAVELDARRPRTILMMTAVALSVGSLLGAVGFAQTAARQVEAQMAASGVDLVRVIASTSSDVPGPHEVFPAEADDDALRLEGVEAAGRRLDVSELVTTSITRPSLPLAHDPHIRVVGVTSGYLEAVGATLEPGASVTWLLDSTHRAVVMGPAAAEALGIPLTTDLTGLSVTVNGLEHQVAGVVMQADVELDDIVLVPYAIALELVGDDDQTEMLVRTSDGGGAVVSRTVRHALRPDAPERLTASPVVDRTDLRAGVAGELSRLAAWVGALLLALSVLLIANSMVVSVMSRVREIGLRRAIGYGRRDVAAAFLVEGTTVGMLGGFAGAGLGAGAVVAVAAVNNWTAVLSPAWVCMAPALGALTGLASASYPALRASAIEPALAVRSD